MASKKQERYFECFVEMSTVSCEAAIFLREVFVNYIPEKLEEYMEKMHAFEHQGDEVRHNMVKLLAKEFITPIEREDIMAMGDAIDTVTDKIEDVLQKMYMYNVKAVRGDAIEGVEMIIECTEALKATLEEFPNFKKSKTINEKIIEINRLEEAGDRFYIRATNGVFTDTELLPLEAFSWSHIYHYMEDVLDACEDAADIIEGVIMKNS
jgi:predicted phosphate transport protein (TIGR00153 family)